VCREVRHVLDLLLGQFDLGAKFPIDFFSLRIGVGEITCS